MNKKSSSINDMEDGSNNGRIEHDAEDDNEDDNSTDANESEEETKIISLPQLHWSQWTHTSRCDLDFVWATTLTAVEDCPIIQVKEETPWQLSQACAVELLEPEATFSQTGSNAVPFLPKPHTLHALERLPKQAKKAWLWALKGEIENLIDNGMFTFEWPRMGEQVILTKDVIKAKVHADGRLDKLKWHVIIRGDLQKGEVNEDMWSATTTFWVIKTYLVLAVQLQCCIYQADFIGAYLQASVQERIFMLLNPNYGTFLLELKVYFGHPLHLQKSMYGLILSGKFWFEELMDWLLEYGFMQSKVQLSYFWHECTDGMCIHVLDYVNDMLYFGSCTSLHKLFEEALVGCFNVNLLGQASWFLQTWVIQEADFLIIFDQTHYTCMVMCKYLGDPTDNTPTKSVHQYQTPLPSMFISSKADYAKSLHEVGELTKHFGYDYQFIIGALLFLVNMRADLIYRVWKLTKFSLKPGEVHYHMVCHMLCYVQAHPNLGMWFYELPNESPLHSLSTANLPTDQPLLTFSDSSWQDCLDTRWSTRHFTIIFQGGIVDMRSFLPNPVALSSAKAKYNAACMVAMTSAHIWMMVIEMLHCHAMHPYTIPMILDSSSVTTMLHPFCDMPHSHHIDWHHHYVCQNQASSWIATHWAKVALQLDNIGTKNVNARDLSTHLNFILVKVPSWTCNESTPHVQEGHWNLRFPFTSWLVV